MSTQKEGPNPLRPYYVPPYAGRSADTAQNASSTPTASNRYGSSASKPQPGFGTSARNILADMDYSDYMSESSPSSANVIKSLAEQALWKYTSVFLAQPLDVAKTVLQVRTQATVQRDASSSNPDSDMRRRRLKHHDHSYRDYNISSDSEEDSPSYFTSTAPLPQTRHRQSRPQRRQGSPDLYSTPSHTSRQPPSEPKASPHSLDLKSYSSLTAVLSSLWTTEGAWGIWKGTNSTYVHSVLLSTITSFARSFLAAIFAIPDPSLSVQISQTYGATGGLDILNSPTPLASLAIAVFAASIAGAILAPLDIARIKLMLTPSTHPPRSVWSTLKSLSSWTMPVSIAPVTFLHSTLPTLTSASLPLFLRSKVGIDPLLTPNLYAIATFIGQGLELGLRLPIETVLRRGQLAHARSTVKGREMQTVVEVGPYKGLLGTMYSIVYEEGEGIRRPPSGNEIRTTAAGQPTRTGREPLKRRGQGFEGLWRGWRVGMWGLIGVWGATTLGGVGSKGGEF
ncbi:MAG: hypothetical protein Q9190_004338 [Brigantiaea leucoxantha]